MKAVKAKCKIVNRKQTKIFFRHFDQRSRELIEYFTKRGLQEKDDRFKVRFLVWLQNKDLKGIRQHLSLWRRALFKRKFRKKELKACGSMKCWAVFERSYSYFKNKRASFELVTRRMSVVIVESHFAKMTRDHFLAKEHCITLHPSVVWAFLQK